MSWRLRASLWFATFGNTAPYADPCAHPHKVVATSREDVHVDRLIAPLIEVLWESGIETYSSCQGERSLRRMATAAMPNLVGHAYRASVTVGAGDIYPLMTVLHEASVRHGAEPGEAVLPAVAPGIAHLFFDPLLLTRENFAEEVSAGIAEHRAAEKKAVAAAKRKAARKKRASG